MFVGLEKLKRKQEEGTTRVNEPQKRFWEKNNIAGKRDSRTAGKREIAGKREAKGLILDKTKKENISIEEFELKASQIQLTSCRLIQFCSKLNSFILLFGGIQTLPKEMILVHFNDDLNMGERVTFQSLPKI